MNPTLKKALRFAVFTAIGVGLLYIAFRGQDFSKLKDDLQNANYWWIAIALAFGMLSHVLRALRWNQLFEPLGYKVSLSDSFAAVLIGYFVNFIVPRGGEIARCTAVNRMNKVPFNKAIGTVVSERLIDVIMLLLVLGLAFLLQLNVFNSLLNEGPLAEKMRGGEGKMSGLAILAISGAIILALVFFTRNIWRQWPFMAKIIDFMRGLGEGFKTVLKIKNPWLFIFYSFAINVCYFLLPYFTFYALPSTAHLGWGPGLTVLALGAISIAAPAPGGLGLFHLLIAYALTLYGIEYNDGLSYATLAHGAQMIMLLAFGGLSFFYVTSRSAAAIETDEEKGE